MATKKNETTDAEYVDVTTGEIVSATDAPMLSVQRLDNLPTDAASLRALFGELGLTEADLVMQGDPYPIVMDKGTLENVPLAFVQWRFGVNDQQGYEYVMIKAVRLDTSEKLTIFDAGAGIYRQMSTITDARIEQGKPAYNGLLVERGISRSDYGPRQKDGRTLPGGTTFYLAA